ncbi:type II toxin-antitoxin system RelE/ParE family toxin [Acidisoma cladoniae]|jgi:phage-related protein|uniref:type II toxin-antitoxin system RelE/ParE family toxin n=1 Tax=Acidisoma cladoniae TaxID=3040935 RepID=UPI002549E8AF|nr:type II toxin-antitoxin system RelE/ParE family toxin [Acidisoma sp. PAMC 29798]
MKRVTFLGDSLGRVRDFPPEARSEVGFQIRELQQGRDPSDWKPLKTVGQGVREIRVHEATGTFRVIYLATLPDRVLVLHAFQKKTTRTTSRDLELATNRLRTWME